MVDRLEVIKIDIDIPIPKEIRKVDHISNTRKAEMARMIADGQARVQEIVDTKTRNDQEWQSKFDMIFEIMHDKCIDQDDVVEKPELISIAGEGIDEAVFMQKLNKYIRARDGGIFVIKKTKRGGRSCYKLVKMKT